MGGSQESLGVLGQLGFPSKGKVAFDTNYVKGSHEFERPFCGEINKATKDTIIDGGSQQDF